MHYCGNCYIINDLFILENNATVEIHMAAIRKKIVVVGDGACGKTCLLIVFSKGYFPLIYVPTVFENYVAPVKFYGRVIELALWDTAGQEDYDRLRPLSYSDTDVIMICFSVNSPDSLENVTEKWYPEVRHFCPDVPIIVVGNKIDLRDDIMHCNCDLEDFVTYSQGYTVAEKIGAYGYVECSAKSKKGISDVFEMATYAAFAEKKKNKPKCTVM